MFDNTVNSCNKSYHNQKSYHNWHYYDYYNRHTLLLDFFLILSEMIVQKNKNLMKKIKLLKQFIYYLPTIVYSNIYHLHVLYSEKKFLIYIYFQYVLTL